MLHDVDQIVEAVKSLERHLHTGKLRVTFTKKDGTERVMLCTQNHALIPVEKMPKPAPTVDAQGNAVPVKAARPVPPHLVVVFDLDKGEWRSFGITTVKTFAIVRD